MYHLLLILQSMGLILSFLCIHLIIREKPQREQKSLLLTAICVYAYCLGYFLELIATTYTDAVTALKIEYMGTSYLVICYLSFFTSYYKARIKPIIFTSIIALDTIVVWCVLRLEEITLYYKSVTFIETGLYPHVVLERGALYYIFFYVNICLILFGAFLSARTYYTGYLRSKEDASAASLQEWMIQKHNLFVLLLTSVCPICVYIFTFVGWFGSYDPVPLSFLASMIIMIYVISKDQMFDILKSAHDSVLATMEDALIIVDENYRFLEGNKAAVSLFPELKNMVPGLRVKGDVMSLFQKMDVEYSLNKNDRYYQRHISGIYNEDKLSGYVVLMIDVTSMKNLVSELMITKQKADEANLAKSKFLANMSHDIRTPMNAIVGYSDLMIQESTNQIGLKHVQSIKLACGSLLGIVNSILDITTIESGKMKLVDAPYMTATLIKEILNIISVQAQEKGLELYFDIEGNVPSEVIGDYVRVFQVLMNLLGNSIKFTKHGFVHFTMKSEISKDDYVRFTFVIEDTGIGIREEDSVKIYERFGQVDTSAEMSSIGTGLGLSIVKSLLHLMNGSISYESEYGVGTEFTISFEQKVVDRNPMPNIECDHLQEPIRKSEVELYAPEAEVLVVDDNKINRDVLCEFLDRFGIMADTSENGYDAIEKVKDIRYDVIFMDQMMPGIDGVETMKRIRELGQQYTGQVIIALTANAIRGTKNELMNAGFDDYLSKPIGIHTVEEKLLNYLPKEKVKMKHILEFTKSNSMKKTENSIKSMPQEKNKAEIGKNTTIMEVNQSTKAKLYQHIDIQSGLEKCDHDIELFLQTLEIFKDNLPAKIEEANHHWSEGDYKTFTIEIHALKSNAALIGAMEISDLAKELEFAGKEDRFDIIDQKTENCIVKLRELAEEIGQVIVDLSGC